MDDINWNTPTMAELYLKQGHREKALAIFRQRRQTHPADLQSRLRLIHIEHDNPKAKGESMSFRERLEKVVREVPGATSAMIMGFDGLEVDGYHHQGDKEEMAVILIEYSAAIQKLRDVEELMPEVGGLKDLTITRDTGTCLLRPLSEDYFLAMMVGKEGLPGKARFMMRLLASDMHEDFV